MIYYLSISGYYQGVTAKQAVALKYEPEENEKEEALEINASVESEIKSLHERLVNKMDQEKLFLDPSINLSSLSKTLETQPTLLSKAINSIAQMNFNDFINRYRIELVKEKMNDPEQAHLSLLAIALDCGFNSKATFNRAFKKKEGVSPSTYQAKNQSSL